MPALTSPKTFDCEVCSAALRTQRDLDNHMCLHHDDCGEARLGTPITFRCATCGEGFARRGDLFTHQQERGHGHPSEWGKPRVRGRQRPARPAAGGRRLMPLRESAATGTARGVSACRGRLISGQSEGPVAEVTGLRQALCVMTSADPA